MLGTQGKSNFTPNAIKVLERRYLKKENDQIIETPEDMLRRVAGVIARVDEKYYGKDRDDVQVLENSFYKMMADLEFMPNSPTLMNAGRALGQLSACFVLPVGDSMEEIFDAIKNAAIIHKSGGGTGFSFSRLRPVKSAVRSTGGVASGPVSFMKVFNAATEAVKQGGTRRGANMGILRVDHPDVLQFISCKGDNAEINNFNISIGITNVFMKALANGTSYDLIDPRSKEVVGQLPASEVFETIVDHAWKNGEPGVVFIDTMNDDNPTPLQGEIEATNPCGEQPLLPNEACNLGSLNLKLMVIEENGKLVIDWDRLSRVTRLAVHFLDNVIDANQYPLPIIDEVVKKNRKIGLGVMGFADLLIMLQVSYASEEAVEYAENIMNFIRTEARMESLRLAKERGTYPSYEDSIYKDVLRLRNATITTIAPTGTISMICSASSGVEPLFAIAYTKTVMDGTALVEINPLFEQFAKEYGFYSEELMKEIADRGTVMGLQAVPNWIQEVFVTAQEIAPEWHIRIQAAFQKYTDNAVSKTINFSNSATREEIAESYQLAYDLKCKGLTVYRDGSREEQVLSTGASTPKPQEKKQLSEERPPIQGSIVPRPRPITTTGVTKKVKIGCGNLYVSVNADEKGICEVFTNTGRAGGCSSQSEATARLISVALRSGLSVESIVEQVKGIRCPACIRRDGVAATSCPDAIARVIKEYHDNGLQVSGVQKSAQEMIAATTSNEPIMKFNFGMAEENTCPECGAKVDHASGCYVCNACGYSKCG